jgi:poly(beta-D-mannuronate) lyase
MALLLILTVSLSTTTSIGAEIDVDSLPALRKAIGDAKPGDHIIAADGRYESDRPITVAVAGTAERPIFISAQSVGGVEIAGDAGFRLESPASYIVIRGFHFTHKAGEMRVAPGVHHCRATLNVFELEVTGRARYLLVSGDDNEIDHNTFRNKSTEGQMLQVEGPDGQTMARRTWIHHNHFHDFHDSRRNNSSALHIGHSGRSMSSGYTVVEHNLFERTTGENEGAICNKATDNIYRYNTFGERSSELSLRHGKGCLVYGNFFLGGNGVRFFGHDHRIYNNYFQNCRPAIAIGNGGATIPPGPLTSHERPDLVQIVHNTLVNNRANVQMSRRQNGLGANDLVFANNIIVGGNEAVAVDGPLVNPTWTGNLLWNNDGGPGDIPASGYTEVNLDLATSGADGYRISAASPAINHEAISFAYVTHDIDGQPRGTNKDIGADQASDARITNRPLTAADVGPTAPEADRSAISAPILDVEWIVPPGVSGKD